MASNSKIYEKMDAIYEHFNGSAEIVVVSAFTSQMGESC
jgi:hypothetical protein